MTFSITIGAWIMPLAITIASFGFAEFIFRRDRAGASGSMFNMDPLLWAGYHSVALNISLLAWLIWAVIGS